MPYGAFVEFMPGKQGLLHISEVSWKRLETMEGVLTEGEKVKVKLTGTDPKTGKFKLSRKILLPKPEGMQNSGGERRDGGQRDDRREQRFEPRRDDRRQGDRPKIERHQPLQNNEGNEQQTPESNMSE
jgi:polyribonucleotide nucleotidyltransferase